MTVVDLCALTGASEATVRRDINTLDDQKRLRRVRGGAEAMTTAPFVGLAGRPFSVNETMNSAAKQAIAAAAVELWAAHLEGAVVAIGNAPTALFHLLELLDHGAPKPAVILGFPVGFVGAAESKAELASNPRGCDFVALRGRRGGSAIASAAVNALSAGLPELVA